MFIPNSPRPPSGIAHNEGVVEGVFKGRVFLALASSYHTRLPRAALAEKDGRTDVGAVSGTVTMRARRPNEPQC